MDTIEGLRKLVKLATKSDEPRDALVERLLRQIAEADSLGFIETYETEHPTSGEMLRVIARYTKAMRAMRENSPNIVDGRGT